MDKNGARIAFNPNGNFAFAGNAPKVPMNGMDTSPVKKVLDEVVSKFSVVMLIVLVRGKAKDYKKYKPVEYLGETKEGLRLK